MRVDRFSTNDSGSGSAHGRSSAAWAEGSIELDGSSAHSAVRDSRKGSAEDVAGDERSLYCVVITDPARHQEAFDESEDRRDSRPGKEHIQDAQTVAAQIEVMNAEAPEQEREENAHGLFLASVLIFGIEPGTLLRIHVGGVHRVAKRHHGESPKL